jgi:crossover junction endodeoxyribonuclease RuvC
MIIIGIDPGTRRMGYGVIELQGRTPSYREAGIFKIDSKTDAPALLEVQQGLEELFRKWRPATVAVEKLFFLKNRTTGIQVAQARGVVLAVCAAGGIPIEEYAPNEIKAGLTGYGGADKKAVHKMVRLILNQPELKLIDDASDALGIAILAAERIKFRIPS